MLALGVFSLMSVEQQVHAQATKYGTSARLAYPGYYQLTLIDQLRIWAARYHQAYYRQYAIMINTKADRIRVQQQYLAAVRQMQWNYQQYRKVMENINKLQQQQNGSGNYQTVKR